MNLSVSQCCCRIPCCKWIRECKFCSLLLHLLLHMNPRVQVWHTGCVTAGDRFLRCLPSPDSVISLSFVKPVSILPTSVISYSYFQNLCSVCFHPVSGYITIRFIRIRYIHFHFCSTRFSYIKFLFRYIRFVQSDSVISKSVISNVGQKFHSWWSAKFLISMHSHLALEVTSRRKWPGRVSPRFDSGGWAKIEWLQKSSFNKLKSGRESPNLCQQGSKSEKWPPMCIL